MKPEERVKIVVDILAEEIIRQMREMAEAEEKEATEQAKLARRILRAAKSKPKPEVAHGRDRI